MVAIPIISTGCLLCRLLLTTKEMPTFFIPCEAIREYHLMMTANCVLISAWELLLLSPTELTQHREIPVMENLHLCSNNRPSNLPKNKYYLL